MQQQQVHQVHQAPRGNAPNQSKGKRKTAKKPNTEQNRPQVSFDAAPPLEVPQPAGPAYDQYADPHGDESSAESDMDAELQEELGELSGSDDESDDDSGGGTDLKKRAK